MRIYNSDDDSDGAVAVSLQHEVRSHLCSLVQIGDSDQLQH
jgi:hypothetical protein